MHTIMVIGGGLVLLSCFLLVAIGLAPHGPGWHRQPRYSFRLADHGTGEYVLGVSCAGYTVLEELPMLLFVFGGPAAVAGLVLGVCRPRLGVATSVPAKPMPLSRFGT
jgi:hypothetical protein